MSPFHPLRDFIRERLTAAAEEIFTEVEKTIVRYEEDIRLLGVYWKPPTNTNRTNERPNPGLHTEEGLRQTSFGEDQEEREPSHVQQEVTRLDHDDRLEKPEFSWLNLDLEETEAAEPTDHWADPDIKEELGGSEPPAGSGDQEGAEAVEVKEEWDEAERLQIKEEEEVEQFILKQEHFDFTEPPTQEAEPNVERLHALGQSGEGSVFPTSSSSDKSVKCDVCGKVFKKKHHFNRHQRIHSGVRPYACTICGKGFTQSGHLKNHIRTHTGERPFSCHTCGKSFSQVVSLNVHMRIHTGERPYSCEICGKSFTVVTNLNFHRGTHADERPFPCETCGKGFGNFTSLKAHRRIHTQGRLHFCQTCGKSFTKNAALGVHMRTHTGERPYLCERCGKRFISKGDLKAHVRTHTGERPFACGTCGKSFIQRGTLNVHMKSHAAGDANAD